MLLQVVALAGDVARSPRSRWSGAPWRPCEAPSSASSAWSCRRACRRRASAGSPAEPGPCSRFAAGSRPCAISWLMVGIDPLSQPILAPLRSRPDVVHTQPPQWARLPCGFDAARGLGLPEDRGAAPHARACKQRPTENPLEGRPRARNLRTDAPGSQALPPPQVRGKSTRVAESSRARRRCKASAMPDNQYGAPGQRPTGTKLNRIAPKSGLRISAGDPPPASRSSRGNPAGVSCWRRPLVAAGGDGAQLVHHRAGARRDQPADDDVLLQAHQRVDLAGDAASVSTRVVSWNEAAEMKLRLQAGLGDALQHRHGRWPACRPRASLAFSRSNSTRSTCSPARKVGVARIEDLHLLQHLADDHFDVLVVDLHALQPVDVLDFVHQVVRQRLDARARAGCRAARAGRRPAGRRGARSRPPAPRRACPSGSGTRSPRRSRRSSRSTRRLAL